MAIDSASRVLAVAALSSGGGSEPASYLKNASVESNTLTLTKKDDTTVVYTPSIPSYTAGDDIIISNNEIETIYGGNKDVENKYFVNNQGTYNNEGTQILCGQWSYQPSNIEDFDTATVIYTLNGEQKTLTGTPANMEYLTPQPGRVRINFADKTDIEGLLFWEDGSLKVRTSNSYSQGEITVLSVVVVKINGLTVYTPIDGRFVPIDNQSITLNNQGKLEANVLPSLPQNDGTYTLQLTISDGVPTYSWVQS